jgi:hypothetical protein
MRHLSIGKPPRPRGLREGAVEPAAEAETTQVLKNVIPDRYRLVVQPLGNGGDYVASVKFGDLDVLHGEFPVGAGGGEIHVTVRGDSASVEGKVTVGGQPAVGAMVYLMPADGAGSPKFGFCDAEGSYHIQGVAPGDYRILAWRGQPPADMQSAAGERLSLGPGEHRTQELEAASGSGQSSPEGGFVQ